MLYRQPGLLVLSLMLSACIAEPIAQHVDEQTHKAQNQKFISAIRKVIQHGDWIVIRGYHVTDNLVANATGIPISHAAVYDPEQDQVIEAEGQGVHLSTLADFVDKSHRLIVIQPRWANKLNRHVAVLKARSLIGKQYDFLGTIGINSPESYYCSELTVEIYRQWHHTNEKLPGVIKPAELYLYGTIIYDSLPRDYQ